MATYKTEAIIIKRQNFGEADKILTIFSKWYGKKKVIAKGVRRTTSRKGGNVELFNQVVLFLAQAKTFDIVTEAQVVKSFEGFRKDLKRVSQAYYACELVDRLTAEEQEHRQVFDLLVEFLESLTLRLTTTDYRLLAHSFELKLLKLLGFWGVGRIKNSELRIQKDLLEVLRWLEDKPFDQLSDLEIAPELLLELERFLKYYIESIAEARIKSADFVEELNHV